MKPTNPIQALRTTRYFVRKAWQYKALLIGTFVAVPAASLLLYYIPPVIIAGILDNISAGNFVQSDVWASFGWPLVWYAALTLLGGVLLWRIAVFCIWRLEMRVLQSINQEVFAHLMKQSATFHANRFAGSMVSQTNKLASAYVRFADTMLFDFLTLSLSFIFSFAILLPRVPWIATALMVFSVIFMLIAAKLTKSIREARGREASAETRQTGLLADSITNVLAVKSFAGGSYENSRFAKATDDVMQATDYVMWKSLKHQSVFATVTVSIGVIAVVMAVAAVVMYNANIGTAFLVITYTGIIGQRLWDFAQTMLRNLNRSFGDAQDMMDILALEPEIIDRAEPEKAIFTKGAIDFVDVDFNHPESGEKHGLFRKLNVAVQAGEKIGLVGHSGSGKTTFTKLLLRFNDVDSGQITIDGQNIASVTQDDLRRAIAYVPQEPLLFHRTIRENIAYGNPGATKKQVETAAKKAHAHDFIQKLAKGYDTLVGERGVKLSGGQRQRIAIARAILKDAPILVLDEATSALDSENEKLIQSALWELMAGRTAIVIAHRLSTIQKMDRILVMENGDIVEQGTHQQLLKARGVYAKLWAHQSGGFIEE
ncbi:MAG TPA: ABC transporter ATP-binding protein [Candidatus Saccharimonadales bacterium]|nr:ABC transporter ATP-binding protein [Candidatus Saccharimonadales bacterium]